MTSDLPTITITPAALEAFRSAMSEDTDDPNNVLRLSIDSKFQNDLYFGQSAEDDLVVTASGIPVAMDPRTARRADGLTIDYVTGPTGTGFKIENPNESPAVKGIRTRDFLRMLEAGEKLEFVDARPPDERAKALVALSRALDEPYEAALRAMPKTTKMVFMAHHSRGGLAAAQRLYDAGFSNVWYIVGGIDAWSTMDADIPRY